MKQVLPDLGRQILMLLEQEVGGLTRSQVEEHFPTSSVGQSLNALERRGLVEVRYRARGGGPTPIRIYVRTARPVNDQLKITVFIEAPKATV